MESQPSNDFQRQESKNQVQKSNEDGFVKFIGGMSDSKSINSKDSLSQSKGQTLSREDEDFQQNPPLQNREETNLLPKSSNSDRLPLSMAVVLFPELKETNIQSYMLYKIKFIWNNNEIEINRRFSDFKELRKAIRLFLPFSYIFPVHKAQIVVSLLG
jgi:hypothetical protein